MTKLAIRAATGTRNRATVFRTCLGSTLTSPRYGPNSPGRSVIKRPEFPGTRGQGAVFRPDATAGGLRHIMSGRIAHQLQARRCAATYRLSWPARFLTGRSPPRRETKESAQPRDVPRTWPHPTRDHKATCPFPVTDVPAAAAVCPTPALCSCAARTCLQHYHQSPLELRGVEKSFGPVHFCRRTSREGGEVTALFGDNGGQTRWSILGGSTCRRGLIARRRQARASPGAGLRAAGFEIVSRTSPVRQPRHRR